MPEEPVWQTFFDVHAALTALGLPSSPDPIAEFGCGYGTFTLPAARRTQGPVYAFDIERELIERLNARSATAGLSQLQAIERDFMEAGTGLDDHSVAHAMAYNILHIEEPLQLLKEALRILRPGGQLSVMHWHPDPTTPRGPPMAIRPRPEQIANWAQKAGFTSARPAALDACCPYHYGLVLQAPS